VITRRQLLIALGCSLAAPLVSFAQQRPAKIFQLGFLSPTSASGAASSLNELRAGLRDLGYVEGKNIHIDFRGAEGKYERLPALAGELVDLKVDVIVAAAMPAIKAAQRATNAIPIVMVQAADPVDAGVITSLSRPGANITGLSDINVDLSSKYLELMRVAVPKLASVAVLVNPGHPNHPNELKNIRAAASSTGVHISAVHASAASQIEPTFNAMTRAQSGALIVLPDGFFRTHMSRIANFAMKNRLPTMLWSRELVEAGGLMSYGQNLGEHYRRAATYVDKILKGAKPGDLPVEQPTKLEFVVNLKTANAIGLTTVQDLLFRADKVIQ